MGFFKKHKILTTFFVLLILVVGFGGAFVWSKLNMISYHDGKIDNTAEDNQEEQASVYVVEDESELSDEIETLEQQEIILSDMEIFSDSNVFNILLLGTDERKAEFSTNARADSIMLLSINKEKKSVKLVSLQRGMGVPILEGQYKGQYDWLTHCFRYGGADLMLKEVQECLRVDVDRYVRVNFNTFEQLINCVGGVDVDITQAEADGLNGKVRTNAEAEAEITVGMNHLSGYDALQYSRLRYIDSDWRRVERQRKVLQAVFAGIKEKNLLELNSMADTMLPLVQTNLEKTEILELVTFLPVVLGSEVDTMTIPRGGTFGSMPGMGGRSLYAVDFETNANILKSFLYYE